MERDSQYYIDKGFIDVSDNAEFRKIADAASCFGKEYRGLQRSYFKHPRETGKRLWFPKFYENKEWSNRISDDETAIISTSKLPHKVEENVDKVLAENNDSIIVFGRSKNAEGKMMYHFKGEYRLNASASNYEKGLVYERIGTRVQTYPNAQS
ncbi:MAG: hypothetical protein M3384_21300 [Acidobacteriota bacterium]|nr:hypothetical protein [Acidobacteriota bacterium]